MNKRVVIILLFLAASFSCKKHTTPKPSFGRSTNLSPTDQQPCTPSSFVNDSTGMITFNWSSVSDASGYVFHLRNLKTHQLDSISTSNSTLQVPLHLATPYGWYIAALQSGTTIRTNSDNTTFYVAGKGNTIYAPFPATLISPAFGLLVTGGNSSLNLTWKGSDVQNVQLKYTVYFGTTSTPPKYASGISDVFLNNVSVSSGQTYYWQVESVDPTGNNSYSDIYQFTTKE